MIKASIGTRIRFIKNDVLYTGVVQSVNVNSVVVHIDLLDIPIQDLKISPQTVVRHARYSIVTV